MNRRAASALVVWCLVVAAGIVAVWLVISRVGDEVTDPSAMVVQPTGTVAAGDPRPRSGGRPEPRRHGPSKPSGHGSSAAPSASGSPPATTPPASPPSSGSQSPGATSVTARPGTWQGTAGLVRVTCRGPSISLTGASPNPGWRINIGSRGPQEVEVELEKQGGERHTQVRAVCSGGTPRFTVHNEGEGDG